MVWLNAKDLKTERPSKKLDNRRYDPYKIIKIVGLNSYELKLLAIMKIHPVFNTVRLMPYYSNAIGRKPLL